MNDLSLYWWRPTRPTGSLATELRYHSVAWAMMQQRGGGFRNFGDEVSRDILPTVLTRTVRWAPLSRADLIGTGSILDAALRKRATPLVFGSGFRDPSKTTQVFPTERIVHVRGELTRQVLKLNTSVRIGDPGLLAANIYGHDADRGSMGALFIPHFAMLTTSAGRAFVAQLRRKGWTIVFPNRAPKEVAHAISRATLVVTTSLHAHVFAHAYGVPTRLLDWSVGPSEPDFKYEDYLSVFQLELERVSVRSVLDDKPEKLAREIGARTRQVADLLAPAIASINESSLQLRERLICGTIHG